MERDIRYFDGQDYEFLPVREPVPMYVREPSAGCNNQTGLLLLVHYWTGHFSQLFEACDVMADRFNVVAVTVNYLQSEKDHADLPYDLGLVQTMDCLRALWHVQKDLHEHGKPFDARRIAVAGQSGGGQIALMCAKLAPHTFSFVFDLCGVSGLSDDIAFAPYSSNISAKWSPDPKSPRYLSPAKQEIRYPGNLEHLRLQFQANPTLKFVIVHSLDDMTCPIVEKLQIYRNLILTGYRPSACFVTPAEIDGEAIQTIEHHLGDPCKIYCKFGERFLNTDSELCSRKNTPTDFESHNTVSYPVTGGFWDIDYSSLPTLHFRNA